MSLVAHYQGMKQDEYSAFKKEVHSVLQYKVRQDE